MNTFEIKEFKEVACATIATVLQATLLVFLCVLLSIRHFYLSLDQGEYFGVIETFVDCLKFFLIPLLSLPVNFVIFYIGFRSYNVLSKRFGCMRVSLEMVADDE